MHDSEAQIDVGHCLDPGCYSRAINYNASSKQIQALVSLSGSCSQSIRVIYYAPKKLAYIVMCYSDELSYFVLTSSTIVSLPRWNSALYSTRGGTIEMAIHATSGLEATPRRVTPVSVA